MPSILDIANDTRVPLRTVPDGGYFSIPALPNYVLCVRVEGSVRNLMIVSDTEDYPLGTPFFFGPDELVTYPLPEATVYRARDHALSYLLNLAKGLGFDHG